MPRANNIKSMRATTLRSEGDETILRYHNTDVFRYNRKTKTAVISNGGYRTDTTKRRINFGLQMFGINAGVYQRDFEWFVNVGGFESGKEIPFQSGMKIKA